jgi:hypothetical protein
LRQPGDGFWKCAALLENNTAGSGFSLVPFLPDCGGWLCHTAAKSTVTTTNRKYRSFIFPFRVWDISYEFAFSPKPVNEWMAPATARPIEFAGALPDLFFGRVIFDFDHHRPVIAAPWTRNLDGVVLLFHDFGWLIFEKNRWDV